MFPMTRPLRQTISTILLLVGTVFPTAIVATIAWRINQPGHVRDVEIELGRTLGMQVSLASVGYPGPGQVVYRGMILRGQEPRGKGFAEIGRADSVRLNRADHELTVLLENPVLHAESPALGLARLDELIQRSVSLPFERVGLSAPTCQIELGRDDLHFTFKDVAGEFLSDTSAPTLKLAYEIPGSGKSSRCELILARDRRREPFETSLTLKTVEGSPLPARMLNVLFDADDWLGSDAKVLGTLNLTQVGSNRLEGRFSRRGSRPGPRAISRAALPSTPVDRTGSDRIRQSDVGPATWRPRPRLARGQGGACRRPRRDRHRASGSADARDEVSAVRSQTARRLPEDRRRFPLARDFLCDTLERRDPDQRSARDRVSAGRRARGRELGTSVCSPGHGERTRTDQDALPGLDQQLGRSDSTNGRVASPVFTSSSGRCRISGPSHTGWQLIVQDQGGPITRRRCP